ncbi:F-box/FBD/LRR-repeat protein At1g13570-like [Phoenix dactylifera]|uniref:F-box/FBD/LRR-repeat protein At1g13570-like n=1 Tax=Phoenix dactylifera TaxID=42345 RepID=A0A8B7C280_PHODC|nr:F-box/FBD/LRR-repeat protein At1g13570-like [Phoenix dactylifera]
MINMKKSKSERRVRPALNLDMISILPKDILDKILVRLPLRDAIRTSSLSRTWRHAWASMPALMFIDDSIPSNNLDAKFLLFVDRVLLLHNGPILKFHLSSNRCSHVAIDPWIVVLSRNGIQELVLDLGYEERYKVPSTLFFCQELKHVELSHCIIELPQMFKGFSLLSTLKLSRTTLTDKGLENLVSSCPVLENLSLTNFNGCTHLKIHAPKLQVLMIIGFFEDLHLGTPNLVVANIVLDGEAHQYDVAGGTKSNLIQALGSIPAIEKLEIREYFLVYLAVGSLPEKLPTTFNCLRKLTLDINLEVLEETMTALCLFQNAPNLEELELWPAFEETPVVPVGKFWKLKMHQRFPFKHLRNVCLNSFADLEAHFEFVKFVLNTAPMLKKMTLRSHDCPEESKVLRKLLQFPRASKEVEVIYV